MREDDRTYFGRRAKQEAELALLACHPRAARAHRELAAHYRQIAAGGVAAALRGRQPLLRLVMRP